jgi:hypothetical protein
MAGVYTLARGLREDDVEFASIRAMAEFIVKARDALPAGDDGEPAEIALCGANLGRDSGLEGACISVRAKVAGYALPRGQLIGWAFQPEYLYTTDGALKKLMAAIAAVTADQEARRSARVAA